MYIMGESLVLVLSDTHDGKHTPTFNPKVFQGRINSIPAKLLSHPALPKEGIESVHVILGGDMIDGENMYPHNQAVLKESALDQTLHATNVFATMLRQLSTLFRGATIHVHSIPGNHGRVSHIHHPKTNFDNLFYAQLSERLLSTADFEGIPSAIRFEPNYNPFKVIKVQTTKILLYHHGVPHLGTPATRNKFCGWMQRFGTTALVHGHHHRVDFNSYRNYWRIANGSLPGTDDYSDELGEYGAPAQVFFTVSSKVGICGLSYLEW